MKRFLRICVAMLATGVIMAGACLGASAAEKEEGTGVGVEMISNSEEADGIAKVSCGIDVIAAATDMAVAGLSGNTLDFSVDRFASAMNLSRIDNIKVTKLPDKSCGTLYIGAAAVKEGQSIGASSISLMTYEENAGGKGSPAFFNFTVNSSAYEMKCNIYMLDELNYSPTVSMASYASLNAETHRGIKMSGVLSAYDPEGDVLTYEIVKYPVNGHIKLDDKALGIYTYTPKQGYTGKDSFSYVARDIYGNYSASAKVELEVVPQGTSAVYKDMEDSELYNYALTMTERGVMNGIQVGENYYFEPSRTVTRAEFIVSAMNALGLDNIPDVEKTGFFDDKDIKPEMKGYIALAYSKGYISGQNINGELCFRPDETVKMSEAAVIVSNMIGYAEAKVTPVFADADEIPAWSSKAMCSLHTLGIIEAPDGVAGAGETITRGNMAKLLSKTVFVMGK